jgi:WD40 repeat protein
VLFDVRTGKRLATIGDERDIVLAADLSADGKLVALGGPGRIVKVYSASDGRELYEIKKHTDWITALEFSPDGARLATGDRSGGIFLWESANGATAGNFADHKDSVTSLSWRGDGRLLVSASEDGQIIVWNTADGFPVASITKAHTAKPAPQSYGTPPGGVLSVQFAANGLICSVGRDSTYRLWSADGKPQGASKPQDVELTRIAVSSDSKVVIAGDYQGRILIWGGTPPFQIVMPPFPAAGK